MLLFHQTIVGLEADEEITPGMIHKTYHQYQNFYDLTDDDGRSTSFDESLFFMVPMSIVYGIVCLTGLVSNLLVCIVITRDKSMHTPSNCYLFSLAVSDLLLILGLPFEVYQMWNQPSIAWGMRHCYLQNYLAETSSNASILTITAFTIERYLAVCFPFLTYVNSNLSRTIKIDIVIWILVLSLAIPRIIFLKFFSAILPTTDHIIYLSECYNMDKDTEKYFFRISSVLFFFLPMFIITIAYIFIGIKLKNDKLLAVHKNDSSNKSSQESNIVKNKENKQKNITFMLVAIVVAFFVCWAPFHAGRVLRTKTIEKDKLRIQKIFFYLTKVLYYLSSLINPLLYSVMSKKFRDAFKTMFFKKNNDQTKHEDFVLPQHLTHHQKSKKWVLNILKDGIAT